jgi:hypothetical protein
VATSDRRTVGELLSDSDALSRDVLLDVVPSHGPAMVRTWGQVTQSAAQLWAVLPPASPASPAAPDLMVRLRGLGEGVARSAAGHWPGPGPQDQRLLEIARNLSHARDLVERHGRDVQPTSAEARADIAAARARIMHTLYVGAHGTAVALREYAKDLRDRRRVDALRRRPIGLRSDVREIQAAEAMLSRVEVFEQLAAGYVAAHPVTATVLGEVRPSPPRSRLHSALAAWDIQVHGTFAADPDAADLVRIGRVQALIASAAAVVTEAAADRTEIDREMVQGVTVALDAAQVAWSRLAKRWGELASPDSRPDPVLGGAASEVRAAIRATSCDATGWATPDQIASRVDLKRALKSLQLSVVGAIDIAHQGEAEIAREQGVTAYEGISWASARQIADNQLIPLPEPARRGLVNLTNDVIASCNRAVAAAAPFDSGESAQSKRSAPTQVPRRSGHSRTMPRQQPASKGFRR